MKTRSTRPDDVERVRRQLEQWRRRRDRGRRIPESLWKAAVKLACRHGVSKTAQALRLDYYSLKKRVETAPEPRRAGAGTAGIRGAESSGGRFVEIPLPGVSVTLTCVLEVEDGRGARMRLELQGLGAGDLAGVVQSVWSERR